MHAATGQAVDISTFWASGGTAVWKLSGADGAKRRQTDWHPCVQSMLQLCHCMVHPCVQSMLQLCHYMMHLCVQSMLQLRHYMMQQALLLLVTNVSGGVQGEA